MRAGGPGDGFTDADHRNALFNHPKVAYNHLEVVRATQVVTEVDGIFMEERVLRANMNRRRLTGASPLDRFGSRFDGADLVCPDCGYDDADGRWTSRTTGDRVRYSHVCPSCGSIRQRTLDLGNR